MTFWLNDHFSEKAIGHYTFGQMTIFRKSFRSNELSVTCHFGQFTSFSSYINFVFGQMSFSGKMNFQSNGLRLNGDSVKCTFGQMAFCQTVFGQMVFQSNGLSVKNFRSNDFSVK
jgi:hypothetical protein